MRLKHVVPLVVVAVAGGAGIATAAHVTIDPANVPEGYLAAHDRITNASASSISRALRSGKTDLFIQHIQLDPGETTTYRRHPGPVFATVVKGSLQLVLDDGRRCRRSNIVTDVGFAVRPRRAYRMIPGSSGADVYVIQLAPRGTGAETTTVGTPAVCA